MSGSAALSQRRRFAKRRFMLLMLKLAIFIGSDKGASASRSNGALVALGVKNLSSKEARKVYWAGERKLSPLGKAGKPLRPSVCFPSRETVSVSSQRPLRLHSLT